MANRYFKCKNDHIWFKNLSESGFKKLTKRFINGLAVCPNCKPENVPMVPCDPPENKFNTPKMFACRHGHITEASLFIDGSCHVSWEGGSNFENFSSAEEVLNLILDKVLKCRHTSSRKNGGPCHCMIVPIDNSVMSKPMTVAIKTKVRVGDVWDKNNCPEPRETEYQIVKKGGELDAKINQTEFSKKNKLRLKEIRKARLNKPVGKVIDRPTKTKYRDKNDRRPTKKDLDGG